MYITPTHKRRNQFTKLKAKPGHKICCRCEKEKRISRFTKNKSRSDGLDARCKSCKRELRQINQEYNKKKSKEWREANPERFKEKRDAWMQANPQSQNPTRQRWLKKNKFKLRQIRTAYKLRRKEWEVGEVDYDEILFRDGFICHICGEDVESEDISFDHVIPLSKGGKHSMDNIHVAHLRCNVKKNAKLIVTEVTPTIKAG